ncbi:GNAT family N-acetyltransferase [Salinirubrum litoreum]|uniref:GNAT family N-acetyltransferase n=1 Tax=Salinirubrum litoreum TaxID=1126234 RepID=A0ABD5R8Y5_9EURY
MAEYTIRPYRPEDEDGFLALFEVVMGEEKGEDWFAWKYEHNPYLDHVPMIVALDGGTVVGSRPLFPLPVVSDGERSIALQPGDAMVHPAHRRRGVFTRMIEQMMETYSGDHPFYFSFPNHLSLPGHLKHGSEVVSERSSYYRIENPASMVGPQTDRTAVRLAATVGTPVASGYYRVRDFLARGGPDVTVREESEPPVAALATLYRSAVPDEIHVARDEQFYRWRLGNPDWEYTTYVADGDAGPEAAIVTGTSVDADPTVTRITDVVPLENAPEAALSGLIGRAVSEHPETDLFVAPPQGIPAAVLGSFGFHADTTPPLSFLTSQTTHVVRTLTEDWTHNGATITDPNNWVMTFIEVDTN